MRAKNPRRAAAVAAALLGALMATDPSLAATKASAAATQQVGSGTWAIVATTASAPPYPKAALTLNFGGPPAQQTFFFNVVNVGTLPVTGATYTLSAANLGNKASLTVYACSTGAWDTAAFTCLNGGTATAVVTSSGAAASAPVSTAGWYPPTVGGSVQLLMADSKTPQSTTTGTFSVTVSRSSPQQLRAGQTTNG